MFTRVMLKNEVCLLIIRKHKHRPPGIMLQNATQIIFIEYKMTSSA